MEIIKDIIPMGRGNRPNLPMEPLYITIHDTGNLKADAKNHASYVKNPTTKESWHFTVDDKSIYQHLELNESGWHAGDGPDGVGNRRSIGIEICMHQGQDRDKAERNAAWLVSHLVRTVPSLLSFPSSLKQHYDWSKKNCPSVIRGKANGWENFKKMVEAELLADNIPEWKMEIMRKAGELGLIDINFGHNPDEPAEKWFVLATLMNFIRGGK